MRTQFLLAGILFSFSNWAQGGPVDDQVTVTAYRTPQALQRAGSAVSIITSRQIQARQNTMIADALRAVPGVAVARSGPLGAQTQVRIRGAEANQVLVLIDGIEANDLSTNDEFSFEHLNTYDIERIEVVRGPQSALWGSDALAGVINVITRTSEEPLEIAGFLEGGSFDTIYGGSRVGLRTDRARVLLSATGLDSDGSNVSRSGPEDDGYSNTTVNLNAAYALTPALGLDLNARYTDADTDFDGFDDATGLPTDADDTTHATQGYLRAGARLDLLDGRWSHDLRYATTDTDTDTSSEDLATPERDFDHSSVKGNKYGVYYQTSMRVTEDRESAPGDLLTLAVDYERQDFSQRGEAQGIFDPNQDQSTYDTGYAAEYLAYFGPRLSWSASVRRDEYSDFDDVNTWRTTASWSLPATATRLHASFGTGQKTPTFVERFGFYPDQFTGNPDLKPETSKGWDAGVEQRWLDGRVVADLTYFRSDLDDEINGFYCPPPSFACTATNLDGTSRRDGIEATVDVVVAEDYTINLAYTYTDSRADDPNTDEVVLTREVRRPRNTGTVNINRALLDGRLDLNLTAAYTGEREDDFYPPPFFFPAQRVALESYMLVSLAASYQLTGKLQVYGRVENALDEDYEDVYGFNTPGAAGYVGLRLRL